MDLCAASLYHSSPAGAIPVASGSTSSKAHEVKGSGIRATQVLSSPSRSKASQKQKKRGTLVVSGSSQEAMEEIRRHEVDYQCCNMRYFALRYSMRVSLSLLVKLLAGTLVS